ncbi:MAG: hypothetical protein RB292_03045 [Patescibacteria group bacterium]|jgi:hypothetical protein|nr:hypothetical protein [Patescibacteria group bacterium]
MLNQKQLNKFKRCYADTFGKQLSNQAALELANTLLTMVEEIYKPITSADVEKLNSKSKI